MATIKDIAKTIVERHKMKLGASEEFLQMLVEVVNEGLIQDRIVKIKGFGTFKLQEVKERKSVNVNTGESVIIAAHDKVTFTPDNVMRDIVNKPFAQFETVIADGKPEEKPAEEEPVVEESVKDEPVVDEPVREEPVVDEPVKKETVMAEPAEEEPVEEEPIEQPNHYVRNILLVVLLAVLCFALGYFAKSGFMSSPEKEPAKPVATDTVTKPVAADTVAKPAAVDTVAKAAVPAAKPAEKKVENVAVGEFEKYNSDPRVKYGAYKIVGTANEVTVQNGQTLKGISKAYLGPDMECYVEAFNGGIKNVKAGDKIRIPKLEVKKKKNAQNGNV